MADRSNRLIDRLVSRVSAVRPAEPLSGTTRIGAATGVLATALTGVTVGWHTGGITDPTTLNLLNIGSLFLASFTFSALGDIHRSDKPITMPDAATRSAADAGDPQACGRVGVVYLQAAQAGAHSEVHRHTGLDTEAIREQGRAHLWFAAQNGDGIAQFNLGVMFSHGDGANRNERAARYWYLCAARKGVIASP